MGYYETDSDVLRWFDGALTHPVSHIRSTALCLLSEVDCVARDSWLRRAQRDPVAEVVATAVLLEAAVTVRSNASIDLFESDFACQIVSEDLVWEWEYDVVVAHCEIVTLGSRKAWTAHEDDSLARSIALRKAYCGKEEEIALATAIIVGKRVVNQYTRSPRSRAEATRWRQVGRPRYRE